MTKKYLLGIVLSILFIISTSHAGSWNGWIYQNPYPTSNTLLAVKFITPQKGWIAGEKGTILYTEDSGDSWEAQESGTEEDLKSVAFVNEKMGWAVGNGGVIIHSEDGGKTWVSQGETKKASLNKVIFLNEKEGWAVGTNWTESGSGIPGLVLHTTDGGKKWEKQDIGIKRSIASIYFINLQTGWILAGDEVYRTIDGGKKWEMSKLPIKLERSGTIGSKIIISGMGGGISPEWWQGDIFFVNDKQGWAVVGLWFIFYTEDGGKTWVDQLSTGYMSYGLNTISFIDKQNICAGGSSIICTEDGGKTWKERLGIKPGNREIIDDFLVSIWGLSFASQSIGWAVGNDGQLIKTEDGGVNWKVKTTRVGYYTYFLDAKNGWSMKTDDKRNKEIIIKTEDGGDTWKAQKEFETREKELENRVDLKFFFVNPTTGWAVGQQLKRDRRTITRGVNYMILHTSDGGKTWITQFKEPSGKYKNGRVDIGDMVFDVFFINSDIGWAVGSHGLILHTEDGGKHWEVQKSGTKFDLRRVQFIDKNNGWITGNSRYEGIILHTDDGGKNWHIQWKKGNPKTGWMKLHEVFFIDEDKDTGWITGDVSEYSPNDGILLHTTDGGKTWLENSGDEFKDIDFRYQFFLDKNRGVILTDTGKMLKTKDGGKTWNKQNIPIRRNPWHVSEIFKKDSK